MARIYTSASDPLDFCVACFPKSEEEAYEEFGPTACGDGPDGRGDCFGYDSDHPSYDCDEYRCCKCNKLLTDEEDAFKPVNPPL